MAGHSAATLELDDGKEKKREQANLAPPMLRTTATTALLLRHRALYLPGKKRTLLRLGRRVGSLFLPIRSETDRFGRNGSARWIWPNSRREKVLAKMPSCSARGIVGTLAGEPVPETTLLEMMAGLIISEQGKFL